jgi:hypothetical protein
MEMDEKMEVEGQTDEQPQVQQEAETGKKDKEKLRSPCTEYDPDLFVRLLHGESCSHPDRPVVITPQSSTEELPPQSHSCCTCDRFGNAVHCTSKEHLKGQMKSSHPPMRPRRSFDEAMTTFENGGTLAEAAAAAALYHAELESNKKTISIGGKRRYPRHARRSTMPLSQSKPCISHESGMSEMPCAYDPPTQTTELGATNSHGEAWFSEEPLMETSQQEYDFAAAPESRQEGDATTYASTTVRRRLARRFTMPSKCRASSPLAKKPRISRSISLKGSEERGNPPAA